MRERERESACACVFVCCRLCINLPINPRLRGMSHRHHHCRNVPDQNNPSPPGPFLLHFVLIQHVELLEPHLYELQRDSFQIHRGQAIMSINIKYFLLNKMYKSLVHALFCFTIASNA